MVKNSQQDKAGGFAPPYWISMTQIEQKVSTNRPFKQTRALIRLALNDGWTQKEVADVCRTQQSVVSAWAKGTKLAKEGQLTELLARYGNTLRRQSFRLYWNIDPETGKKHFFRVEGKVIFQHICFDLRRDKSSNKLIKKHPEQRLVVHHQGQDSFRLIDQCRLQFNHDDSLIDNYQEEAIWSSFISEPLTGAQLVQQLDNVGKELLQTHPSDGHALPFLIRQALLQHGFPVEGIEEFPAQW